MITPGLRSASVKCYDYLLISHNYRSVRKSSETLVTNSQPFYSAWLTKTVSNGSLNLKLFTCYLCLRRKMSKTFVKVDGQVFEVVNPEKSQLKSSVQPQQSTGLYKI